MNEIIINNNEGTLTVPSMQVAENFGKRHSDVVEAIEELKRGLRKIRRPIYRKYLRSPTKQADLQIDLTHDGFSLLEMDNRKI